MNDIIKIKQELQTLKKDIFNEIKKVIIGQEEIIEKILISLLAGGHSLVIGVPGLAKTLIIKSMSRAVGLDFKRIQFTPDLMPSDIIGSEIIENNPDTNERYFKYIKGPIFANIILADEINRTPPKTQAALLQAMQEKFVTISGKKYIIDEPFFVLATQNPIEQEGTYPLPEAQLDRFIFSINIQYPNLDDEKEISKGFREINIDKIKQIISKDKILKYQKIIKEVPISDEIIDIIVNLVRSTRSMSSNKGSFIKEYVAWGAGPRASQYIVLASKCSAILSDRNVVSKLDIKNVIYNVLQHRIIVNFKAEAENITSKDVIDELIKDI